MSIPKALALLALTMGLTAAADSGKTIKFEYSNADIQTVVKDYSKASGQKFILDPSLRGHITLINPKPVSLEEAFNQLSTALAINGIGISTQGDEMVLMQARNLQRNMIPASKELPPLKPERMWTWVYTCKHISADDLNKQLRILTSKDGEIVPLLANNQLVISDWSSNLQRVSALLQNLDVPNSKKK